MLDKIKEAKVDLNEVNLDDDEEVQQLMQLTGVSTLGAKTQLFKYIRHSRHAAAKTNSQQQNSVDLKDQNQRNDISFSVFIIYSILCCQ
jgi:hypothetical protein